MNHFYRFIMAYYLLQHRHSSHFTNLNKARPDRTGHFGIDGGQMKLHALTFIQVGSGRLTSRHSFTLFPLGRPC